MAKADFYETLGVSKDVSDADLKKAFRKQAMKYHPDRNPDDKKAEAKFKEINEAYAVLSDANKRAAYDRMGHAAFDPSMGAGAGAGGFGGGFHGDHGFSGGFGGGAGFEDMFEDIFADMFGGGGRRGSGQGRTASQQGADLRYNLTVTLAEAYNGTTEKLNIPTKESCTHCHGTGGEPGSKPTTCPTCGGAGQVRISQGFFAMTRTCPDCGGTGQLIEKPCRVCKGEGRTNGQRTLNVSIPKGVDDGTRIRLSGEGEAGMQGAPAGDLYIFIQMEPHPIFMRDGANLHLHAPLSILDATLGTELEIPTPDGGRTRLKIPEGTQPGQVFRLRNKGMPKLNSSTYGDLMVKVDLEVPTHLSKSQKADMEKLRTNLQEKNTPNQQTFWEKVNKFWG